MKLSTWVRCYWTYHPKTNMWIHPDGVSHGTMTDEHLRYLTRNKK